MYIYIYIYIYMYTHIYTHMYVYTYIMHQQGWMTPKIEQWVSHYYGVYVHLPLLLFCSSVTIFVLRISLLGCEQHPIWQVCVCVRERDR